MSTVRPDVAELLHAGYGDRTIGSRLGVTVASVTQARKELGLPPAQSGNKPAASIEDLFRQRTRAVAGGHLEWTGHRTERGTPAVRHNGKMRTAHRIAYLIRTGTEPAGYAHTTCPHPGCVAPDHVADSATTPRRGHHANGGRVTKVSREQIVAMIRTGATDTVIGETLHTTPSRVGKIRSELGLPRIRYRGTTFADKWAANTQATDDGHRRWTGRHRDGIPSMTYQGRETAARRAAFREHHGRTPTGPVRPGCGTDWCVEPNHLEDQPMRAELRAQITAIFGTAA